MRSPTRSRPRPSWSGNPARWSCWTRSGRAGAGDARAAARRGAYSVASTRALANEPKQQLLELDRVVVKLERLVELPRHEIAARRVVRDITADTATELSKAQRQAIL